MPFDDDRTDEYRISPWVWVAYLVLWAVGVPWYWPEGDTTLWFGMPAWVVTAIVASAAVSVLTAVALGRPWPGEGESQGEEEQR